MKKKKYNMNFQENNNKKKLYASHKINTITCIADLHLAKSLKVQEVSFIKMVFDSKYRSKVYAKFDEIYVETDEEREIFESMQKRR